MQKCYLTVFWVGLNWMGNLCVLGAPISKAALSLFLTEAHCSRSRDGNGAFGSRGMKHTHTKDTAQVVYEQEQQLTVTQLNIY